MLDRLSGGPEGTYNVLYANKVMTVIIIINYSIHIYLFLIEIGLITYLKLWTAVGHTEYIQPVVLRLVTRSTSRQKSFRYLAGPTTFCKV